MVRNLLRKSAYAAASIVAVHCSQSLRRSLKVFDKFEFVDKKEMFYDDTGWTEYKMFEMNF